MGSMTPNVEEGGTGHQPTPLTGDPTPPSYPFSRPEADAVYSLSHEPSQLGRDVKFALEVIEEALNLYGLRGLALSFNGGKDCTVLVHLLAAAIVKSLPAPAASTPSVGSVNSGALGGPAIGEPVAALPAVSAVYIRCASPFSEVEAFVDVCVARYNLDLVRISGLGMKEGLRRYLQEARSSHNAKARHALDNGAPQPEREAGREGEAQGIRAILVGTRRSDPHGASLKTFAPTDPTWPPFTRVHPILDWGYPEVWQFLRRLGVGWCKLYNFGYTSLGSTFNTFPNPCLRRVPPPSALGGHASTLDHDAVPEAGEDQWWPAWELRDGSLERLGRESKGAMTPAPRLQGDECVSVLKIERAAAGHSTAELIANK